MPNLLQKASIVLTPTAYDDGKVLCAKPSEAPYGDFDFSRSSAATRVNAQGLVENVQTLSNNLVDNGDFSELGAEEISNGSFSQQGSELVANGSFDTDSNWEKGTGWSISGGTANCDGTQTSVARLRSQTFVVGSNPRLKLTFDVTNYSAGTLAAGVTGTGQADIYGINENGTYSVIVVSSSGYRLVDFVADANFIGSIDNVSVVEVGQDWDFGTGWSGGEDKAVVTNAPSLYQRLTQSSLSFNLNSTYKISITCSEYSSGFVYLRKPRGEEPDTSLRVDGVGTFVFYVKALTEIDEFALAIGALGTDLSITNISVKEVGQNWSLGTGWSIGENKATFDENIGGAENITQSGVLQYGKNYKLTFDTLETNGGNLAYKIGGGYTFISSIQANTTHTIYAVGEGSQFALRGSSNFIGSITNISIIEITDDTDLPRINYEGFSYQENLGDEEILNGDFSDGTTDWTAQGNSDIEVGFFKGRENVAKININNTSTSSRISQPFNFVLGKEYKVEIDVYVENGNFKADTVDSYSPGDFVSTSDLGYWQTLTGYITATRNGTSSFFLRSSGQISEFYIANVSVKEYSGQEVVPGSGCGSWLWEPESRNLITYSSDFSDSSWYKLGGATFESGYLAPDGTLGASKVSGTIGVSSAYLPGANATATRSIYARTVSGTGTAKLMSYHTNTNNLFTLTEQWQRFELTGAIATGDSNFYVDFRDNSQTLDEFIVWGAQAENLPYATSYIPTDGSSATRNQDVCINGGSVETINSEEGVLYAEIAALADDGTNRSISLSDGGVDNRVNILYSTATNAIRAIVVVDGDSKFDEEYLLTSTLDYHKVALKYKANDFSLWIDGVERFTDTIGDTFVINTLQKLSFNIGNSSFPFFGKTKAVAVWKEALSDEELTLLTAPEPVDPTFTLDLDNIANQFTFSRASFGTIVNEEGLIETVSNIGPEEIVNGNFATDSNWAKGAGWSIANGVAVYDGTAGTSSINQNIFPSGPYKITITVASNEGTGTNVIDVGPERLNATHLDAGTHTFYGSTSGTLLIYGRAGEEFVIDNVSVKEYTEDDIPRIDYSTGEKAFLLEPQSTNVIEYSNDFANSYWQKLNRGNGVAPIVTSNYAISPDGTQNADRIQFDATTSGSNNDRSRLRADNVSLVDGVDYTVSFYAKSTSGTDQIIGVIFDNSQIITPTITGKWQRFELTRTQTGTESLCGFDLRGAYGTTSDILVYGYQIERQDYATSYIPTDGSSATRNRDVCTNGGSIASINSTEGVLYFEGSALEETSTSNRHISLSGGSNSNRLYFYYTQSGQFGFAAFVGGVLQANIKYDGIILNNSKVACKYKENDYALWVDGVEVGTDTSASVWSSGTFDRLNFAEPTSTGSPFYGNTKDVQVFTKALSDYQLKQLTTI